MWESNAWYGLEGLSLLYLSRLCMVALSFSSFVSYLGRLIRSALYWLVFNDYSSLFVRLSNK